MWLRYKKILLEPGRIGMNLYLGGKLRTRGAGPQEVSKETLNNDHDDHADSDIASINNTRVL